MDFLTRVTPVDGEANIYLLAPDMDESALGYRAAFSSFQLRTRTSTDSTILIGEMFCSWLGMAEQNEILFSHAADGLRMHLKPIAATHPELSGFLWWIKYHHMHNGR